MAALTAHFSLTEFRAVNAPWQVQQNCYLLASLLLEPVRHEFGLPVLITSGYRDPGVNAGVGGVGDSQHLDGSACDFVVKRMAMPVVYAWLRDVNRWPGELLYYSRRGHIHGALPKLGVKADVMVLDK